MKHDVAIVIVTYNSAAQIDACLQSVRDHTEGISYEVIVVDNGSADSTVERVERYEPFVRLLKPGRNLGFAAGVNLGSRYINAEYLLLLNPDTVVLDQAIPKILAFARAQSGRGLYGGRSLKSDHTLEASSCWNLPTVHSLALFACGLSTIAKHNRWLDPESIGSWQRDSVREVGVVTGCFLLLKASVWQQLGGFDERYFMYGEDADLAMRARSAGFRSVVFPEAEYVHELGRSSSSSAAKMLLLFRGKASLVRQHWAPPRRQLGLIFLATGVGLRALGKSLTRRKAPNNWLSLWRQRQVWLQGYPRSDGATDPRAVAVGAAQPS